MDIYKRFFVVLVFGYLSWLPINSSAQLTKVTTS